MKTDLVISLEMNTGDGPKIFWSVTFLESLRNQGQLIRIWDTAVTVGHKIVKLATKSAVSLIASLLQAFRLCGWHKEM